MSTDDIGKRNEVGCLTEAACRADAQRVLGKNRGFSVMTSSFKIPSREEITKFTITVALELFQMKDTCTPSLPKRMKRIVRFDSTDEEDGDDFVQQILEKNESLEIATQKVIEQLRVLSMQQHNVFVLQSSPDSDFNLVLKDTVRNYRRTETFESVPSILRELIEDCVYSTLPSETSEDSEDTCELVMA